MPSFPPCALGSGPIPLFIDRIKWESPGGTIYINSQNGEYPEQAHFDSDEALCDACRTFAERRKPFVDNPRDSDGAAGVMGEWQLQGRIRISFLALRWRNKTEWEIHEMLPENRQWDIQTVERILQSEPIRISGF